MAFNGDTLFSLQVHIIQYLRLHFPFTDGFCKLQQPVGKCTFSVVNMGNYAKISDVLHVRSLAF